MNETPVTESESSWVDLTPHLDEAIATLTDSDRDALLLRYFDQKSASEIGRTLGLSNEAAQKRVNRAVERLRRVFAARGLTVGASALVAEISGQAVEAAPFPLAAKISATAGPLGAAIAESTATAAAGVTFLPKAVVGFVLIACATVPMIFHHRIRQELRGEQMALHENAARLAQQREESDRILAGLAQNATKAAALPPAELSELIRLRGEVGVLRRQANLAGGSPQAPKAGGNEAAKNITFTFNNLPLNAVLQVYESWSGAKVESVGGYMHGLENKLLTVRSSGPMTKLEAMRSVEIALREQLQIEIKRTEDGRITAEGLLPGVR